MFSNSEWDFVEEARVGRLATADIQGRPHAVPICFGVDNETKTIFSAVDEKPKSVEPTDLRRVRDIQDNPYVALIIDMYDEDWENLAWVQVRGTASLVLPGEEKHGMYVDKLKDKYNQYSDHDLTERPLICIEPGHVVSWGLPRTDKR
ncbi:MAG: TIGR03668 family PPOX class F420-dependent oxidoreductase [Halobacteria archaeon]|nr:TIGR03668 family PPOX class F420-dependent oxidoreductase [Halobacteria archaeon]